MSLTRLSVTLCALIALLGAVSLWQPDSNLDYVWKLLAILMVLGLMVEYRFSRAYAPQVRIHSSGHGYLGRTQPAVASITNPVGRTVELEIQFPASAELGIRDTISPLRIGADETSEIGVAMKPTALGHYAIPRPTVFAKGALGLGWWKIAATMQNVDVAVGPEIRHFADAVAGTASDSPETLSRRRGSGTEFFDLRLYQPGDPLRAIDWKATAKVGVPMTRTRTQDQQLEVMIMIDASNSSRVRVAGMSRLSHYANLAASLASRALHNNDRVGIAVFADDLIRLTSPGKGEQHTAGIYHALGEMRIVPTDSGPMQAIQALSRHLQRRTLLVIMTAVADRGHAAQLRESLAMLGDKHAIMVVSVDDTVHEEYAARLATDAMDPYLAFAADDQLRNMASMRKMLHRIGCHLVASSPELLLSALLNTYQDLRNRRQI